MCVLYVFTKCKILVKYLDFILYFKQTDQDKKDSFQNFEFLLTSTHCETYYSEP